MGREVGGEGARVELTSGLQREMEGQRPERRRGRWKRSGELREVQHQVQPPRRAGQHRYE